ncbi:unnamed protein product [Mycena citricolor]|uniref:Chromo domain-containing protein n=1 Tax=Mycena citricolor TaxID=2018698 RepID=A0AAD2GZ77_9AGAR|nr:unnamed protein product [Mycena citricolor]
MRYRSIWYFMRWKGYDLSHDQWVKHSDIFAEDAIAAFYRKHPNKPRIIAAAIFDSLPFQHPSATICTLRRGAAIQGGGDVRGTPASDRSAFDQACDRACVTCQLSCATARTAVPSASL